MDRRHFLKTTTAASMLTAFESYSKPIFKDNTAFNLKIFNTNWGFKGSMDAFCAETKAAGYDGVEIWWSDDVKDQNELFNALKKHGLEIGFLVGHWSPDFKTHLTEFTKLLENAVNQKVQKPMYINCHSGRDYFSFEQNMQFVDVTTRISKQTGIKIMHESHRSRIMYSAPITRQFMEKNKDLRLTMDWSHWCVVSESLLEDQPETVAMGIERTDHIHARVGHQEGPQVNDPRAPEWEKAVKTHFDWWDKVMAIKKKNQEAMTILTEFGPPNYLPALPYTQVPVANQWEINVYMKDILKKRYA
jgi:sugar phosphate isomerase/epimerase